jgi:predicted nucleic-acid-binding Zn-ribbon protein
MTFIHVNGSDLEAARCPTCGTRHYPPEGVAACMKRHKVLDGQAHHYICVKCERTRPFEAGSKYRGKVCADCRRTGGPHRSGKGQHYRDYLNQRGKVGIWP